jgi:hypothetical protein
MRGDGTRRVITEREPANSLLAAGELQLQIPKKAVTFSRNLEGSKSAKLDIHGIVKFSLPKRQSRRDAVVDKDAD